MQMTSVFRRSRIARVVLCCAAATAAGWGGSAAMAGDGDGAAAPDAAALQAVRERLADGEFVAGMVHALPAPGTVAVMPGGFAAVARAICPEQPHLQNYIDGPNPVVVPGFAANEEAAAVLNAPASHYPIEILRVGIGWASVFGGQPDSLEDSIRLYAGGPPNPGGPIFVADAPQLVDGAINEFNLAGAQPGGSRIINSGPFMVSLKLFAPSPSQGPAPIHDGRGCIPGKNAIYAFVGSGQWFDGCSLGITGQWVIYAVYRRVNCPPPCPADLTGDGAVGAPDLATLLGSWGLSGPADLNNDGTVGAGDLALLLGSWGPCP